MPDLTNTGIVEGEALKVEDIFETLTRSGDKEDKETEEENQEDENEEESEVIPLKDKKKDEEEETDEEKESEDEEEEKEKLDLKEEDEDELELSKIPARAQIKAKYPNIFKDFPALDRIFHREKAFAEIFPTVKDAKSAREDLGEYVKIQDELLSGDITGTLVRVKRTNPKAFDKIANNIIESLIKVDKDSYIEPARVVFKSGLNNLYSIASAALKKDPTNKKAEQMQIAVEMIHEGLFGSSEVTPYEKQIKEEDKENPEVEKLKRERQQIEGEKFQEAHGKITSRFKDVVTKTLEKNIDKNNSLTTYVKNKLIEDISSELDNQLIADKRFSGIIRKLYERARESNYSQASLDNILVALKNKAGSILPDIMRAKKGEALKGTSSVKKAPKTRELSREDESESATTRNSRTGEKKESLTRNERKKESEDPQPGESAFEYLNRKLG